MITRIVLESPRPFFLQFCKKSREFIKIQKRINMLFSKEIREWHIFLYLLKILKNAEKFEYFIPQHIF